MEKKYSNLNFNSPITKEQRERVLKWVLKSPNGPQTFTASNYRESGLGAMANKDPGDVEEWITDSGTQTRLNTLKEMQVKNAFKPSNEDTLSAYDIQNWINNYQSYITEKYNLQIYPYFVPGQDHNLIGIMSSENYDLESQLFKFAATYIREDNNGPVFSRIRQNLYTATAGRLNILDALQGNLSMAMDIITGSQPLIESNNKITVANEAPGKVVDFLQTVSGVEFPWSEIPGNYLSNPANPVNIKPEASTEAGRVLQDLTGKLGELVGIQRRPQIDRKPSDLFIEYTGEGTKRYLFNNLSYNTKYAPNYTTTARSQNSSKIFSFADKMAQGAKNLLGFEPIAGESYIGDDRGNELGRYLNDEYGNPVYGTYNLSVEFDKPQAELFEGQKSIGSGGEIVGKLLWISSKSKNKRGAIQNEVSNPPYFDRVSREEVGIDQSQVDKALSTKFKFRSSSILGKTQEILNTLPDIGGESRSHVANVIDQTARVFRMGTSVFSKGSNIKYVNKYTGKESGVEYCRAWTKDRPFANNSNLMKRTGLIRKFDSSVLSSPYNLNIYPNSNGKKDFAGSTNMASSGGNNFYAKKYMFSIENLAWKSSNTPDFRYDELPFCERGSNGGRIMWFPPYDLTVTDQSSAKWEPNTFLGRPEPVYTYSNTERTGQVSFKVIVDHPSILNVLVRDHFANMTDEQADNYINAFFAGCEDLDFYGLIRKYTTLSKSDAENIQQYLNPTSMPVDEVVVQSQKEPVEVSVPEQQTPIISTTESFELLFFFATEVPYGGPSLSQEITDYDLYNHDGDYEQLLTSYLLDQENIINTLLTGVTTLYAEYSPDDNDFRNDALILFGNPDMPWEGEGGYTALQIAQANAENAFETASNKFIQFNEPIDLLKEHVNLKRTKNIKIIVESFTGHLSDVEKESKPGNALAYRRSDCVINYFLDRIANTSNTYKFKWKEIPSRSSESNSITDVYEISLKDYLGYNDLTDVITIVRINNTSNPVNDGQGCGCPGFSQHFQTTAAADLTTGSAQSIYCRKSRIKVEYELLPEIIPTVTEQKKVPPPKVNLLVKDQEKYKQAKRPPLEEMKRIVMKTLGECYYFKQMEEQTPVIFSSLRENLKYFHPAFHSMTPEGLNSRLTFLQQCVRPGDTIPIKGISDVNDLNARNTTFGPPPICIMRIGDFYHSKIVIREVQIDFENSPWDLNPEGIGIQPMIANVQLQISFIGGHGLERPVERLQNALSHNFYANTEVYDYHSISTNTLIGGKDATEFSKEFLESIQNNPIEDTTPNVDTNSSDVVTQGNFIGIISGSNLKYDELIDSLFDQLTYYFGVYEGNMIKSYYSYGKKITSLFFDPAFREVYTYIVENGAGTTTVEMLGQYKKDNELSMLCYNFKELMIAAIDNTASLTTLLGLYKIVTDIGAKITEDQLKITIKNIVSEAIDGFVITKIVSETERERNTLISILDKLNFIVSTAYDGKITGTTDYISARLTDFDYVEFYGNYQNAIEYIASENVKFLSTDILDNSFNFSNPTETVTPEILSEFLSVFLYGNTEDIIDDVYSLDPKKFPQDKINQIRYALNDFVYDPMPATIDLLNKPIRKNKNSVEYLYTVGSDFTNDQKEKLQKIFLYDVDLGTELNYYKKVIK